MKAIVNINEVLSDFDYPVELLHNFINYQDSFYAIEITRINKEIEHKIRGMEVLQAQSVKDDYQEFILNYLESIFPDIQNKSLLITLFNLYEITLKNICNTFAKILETPITYKDLKGSDLDKCKVFLNKFCGVHEEIFKSVCFEKIELIRQLRNSIVHNGSDISKILEAKKNEKLIAEFEKINDFLIVDNGIALPGSEFLFYSIDLISGFLDELKVSIIASQKSLSN